MIKPFTQNTNKKCLWCGYVGYVEIVQTTSKAFMCSSAEEVHRGEGSPAHEREQWNETDSESAVIT